MKEFHGNSYEHIWTNWFWLTLRFARGETRWDLLIFVQGSALMGLPPPEEPGTGLGNHRSLMSMRTKHSNPNPNQDPKPRVLPFILVQQFISSWTVDHINHIWFAEGSQVAYLDSRSWVGPSGHVVWSDFWFKYGKPEMGCKVVSCSETFAVKMSDGKYPSGLCVGLRIWGSRILVLRHPAFKGTWQKQGGWLKYVEAWERWTAPEANRSLQPFEGSKHVLGAADIGPVALWRRERWESWDGSQFLSTDQDYQHWPVTDQGSFSCFTVRLIMLHTEMPRMHFAMLSKCRCFVASSMPAETSQGPFAPSQRVWGNDKQQLIDACQTNPQSCCKAG